MEHDTGLQAKKGGEKARSGKGPEATKKQEEDGEEVTSVWNFHACCQSGKTRYDERQGMDARKQEKAITLCIFTPSRALKCHRVGVTTSSYACFFHMGRFTRGDNTKPKGRKSHFLFPTSEHPGKMAHYLLSATFAQKASMNGISLKCWSTTKTKAKLPRTR